MFVNRNNYQPVLFLSHGSPMMGIDQTPTAEFLSQLGHSLARPDAIIVFSAHFDRQDTVVITSGTAPKTLHDFYGFPSALYQMQYPAPGSPALPSRIASRYEKNGFNTVLDEHQGWDHGVWMPLKHMFPMADIPIVQISINSHLGPAGNFRYGQIIGDLRTQNILIIGSGGISHNLREVFHPTPDPQRIKKVSAFTKWVHQVLRRNAHEELFNYRQQAPYSLFNHPTQEHFLPLLTTLGSADGCHAQRIHHATEFDVLSLDCYRFDG